MTNEEAIRRIKEFGLHHAIEDLPHSAKTVEAFNLAIESLEKQTEIVHCNECVHWCCIEQPNIGRCALAKYPVGENGFCVYGERCEE